MQASAGGLPPGFPGSAAAAGLPGLPPGLGYPTNSSGAASSLLAGMPPTTSTAALMHMMAGARLPAPGLPHPAELYAEKEKELAKLSALPGPMSGQSDDRNVRIKFCDFQAFFIHFSVPYQSISNFIALENFSITLQRTSEESWR